MLENLNELKNMQMITEDEYNYLVKLYNEGKDVYKELCYENSDRAHQIANMLYDLDYFHYNIATRKL